MENDNRLNIRFEAVDYQQQINEMNHSLRQLSKSSTNNQINSNENYLILPNSEISTFKNKDSKTFELFKKIKEEYNEVRKKHEELFKKSRNETLPKTRKSYSMFVMSFPKTLLFSKLWNEKNNTGEFINREKLLRSAENTIIDFCKDFNTEYEYITLHTDEKGELHFQGLVKNFDKKTGAGLNIQRNKRNGEKCQDIIFKQFQSFGFERGISKDLTKKIHLTTEEYKELKEKEKLFNSLNNENKKLSTENEKLHEANKQISIKENELNSLQGKYEVLKVEYSAELTELKTEILNLTREIDEVLKDMRDFLETETDKAKWQKMKDMLFKYGESGNVKRLKEVLTKAQRTNTAIQKKHNKNQ